MEHPGGVQKGGRHFYCQFDSKNGSLTFSDSPQSVPWFVIKRSVIFLNPLSSISRKWRIHSHFLSIHVIQVGEYGSRRWHRFFAMKNRCLLRGYHLHSPYSLTQVISFFFCFLRLLILIHRLWSLSQICCMVFLFSASLNTHSPIMISFFVVLFHFFYWSLRNMCDYERKVLKSHLFRTLVLLVSPVSNSQRILCFWVRSAHNHTYYVEFLYSAL